MVATPNKALAYLNVYDIIHKAFHLNKNNLCLQIKNHSACLIIPIETEQLVFNICTSVFEYVSAHFPSKKLIVEVYEKTSVLILLFDLNEPLPKHKKSLVEQLGNPFYFTANNHGICIKITYPKNQCLH